MKGKRKFISPKARKLAKELHNEEHLIIEKKQGEENKYYEWYYLMASGIYQNLMDKIESINFEIKSEDLDFISQELDGIKVSIEKLEKSMKEVAKQQKYLWQTLDDAKEQG